MSQGLLDAATKAGIALTVRDGRIEYEAPQTPEADRILAEIAANRDRVLEAIAIRRNDAVARRLMAQGVDTDTAFALSERVAIETEFLSPLLAGARLLAARPVTPEDGP